MSALEGRGRDTMNMDIMMRGKEGPGSPLPQGWFWKGGERLRYRGEAGHMGHWVNLGSGTLALRSVLTGMGDPRTHWVE